MPPTTEITTNFVISKRRHLCYGLSQAVPYWAAECNCCVPWGTVERIMYYHNCQCLVLICPGAQPGIRYGFLV